ncbi:MAG: hypothetical protein JOZ73_01600 [Solirubrobacterales bacterium]|nr:hypothetical protein [Solirubrobacterales bacterium]
MSYDLIASDRAPGLHVQAGIEIPDDTRIAPHVTIYAGVRLGAKVSIEQGAIVGRPQQVDERSRSPRRPAGEPTLIGDGCRIGSGSVIMAGARIAEDTYVGDLAAIREDAQIGSETMIGRGCSVTHNTVIGDRVRVQTDTLVGAWTTVEDDVFVGARVVFVGDPTMGRAPVDPERNRTVVRRASRIGSGAILIPPLEIGEDSVIAAAAVVRADVPPRTVVAGVPATAVRSLGADELLETART